MKINLKYHLYCLLLFSGVNFISISINAQDYRIVKDNIACLYGLKDESGNWKIEPQYMQMEKMARAGHYKVMQNGGWGVINYWGKIILPMDYSEIRENNYEKTYLVAKYLSNQNNVAERVYGLFSWKGNMILEPIYVSIAQSGNNHFYTVNYKGRYGFADTTGIIFKPMYQDLESFERKNTIRAAVFIKDSTGKSYKKNGLVNWEGDTLMPFEYDDIYYDYSGGLVARKMNRWFYFKPNGDTLLCGQTILSYGMENYKLKLNNRDTFAYSSGNNAKSEGQAVLGRQ